MRFQRPLSLPALVLSFFSVVTSWSGVVVVGAEKVRDWSNEELEDHPDPNDENYAGMVYVGKHDTSTGRRVGFDEGNGVSFIFGTAFDETHRKIEEKDLLEHPLKPAHDIPEVDREKTLKDRRHKPMDKTGPKPFGHVEIHELDGGVMPPRVVHVEPFFMDESPISNKEFGKFVRAQNYETEAERYGWSFCLVSFLNPSTTEIEEGDPEAPHWVIVPGAYWRRPEGPQSSYKHREDHPVVHVSHRDAADFCKWKGKRLPGEWEWEAAARAGHYGPSNRTVYSWGDDDSWETAEQYANLWGDSEFPTENSAKDGWRATSPVKTYPPNKLGFYDMTGNVWEWQRGGKHKSRIVRGGSFVDSLTGNYNHAATLGARATLHATTTAANIGFRCAKAPRRRAEYHYVYHDEEAHGQLAIEDEFKSIHRLPQRGWEDRFTDDQDDAIGEDSLAGARRKKKKVVKTRERYSTEL
ncbi:unnamed protein product [Cylindrotheca closterium]|uniref:Sulfatase-modifying factor enzyme-like domain-containing protein n=1 Tax=Cylindrotheca closterium TaxID=2856 RepID=A0AAD2JI25_9STRA|nr:unnamed protein product [Cylindrotheca closterium]